MRLFLRVLCPIALAILAWPATAQAQQAADEQQKLEGVVDYLEHFAVRRVIEAVGVDAAQVASFRREADAERETWSVSGTAAITDLSGNRAQQPYSARLEVLCDSVERRGCWDLKTLTLGQRTFAGGSATVATLAELNGTAPAEPAAPAAASDTVPKDAAIDALNQGAGGEGASEEEIALLRTMAEKGDPEAQYQLAEKYRVGFPVEQDPGRALELYLDSAGQGFAASQFRLGELYEAGEVVERDFGKALDAYRLAADQGHPGAQYALAHIYHLGSGVEQDMAAAMAWYRKAAVQGDEWSQLALGDQYRIGLAVPRDLAQSAEWYRRAADQGNIFAQYELGNAYRYGNGVERDAAQAIKWFRLSAEAGNPSAQLALAELEGGSAASSQAASAPDPAPEPEAAPDAASDLAATVPEEAPDEAPELADDAMAGVADENAAMELPEPGDELAFAALPEPGEDPQVSRLLSQARTQVANLALTTPAGDNAYETYQQVLAVQPDNEAARAGIREIGVEYASLAHGARSRGDTERAATYLDKALELAPDHPDVQAAAAALRPPEPAPSAPAPSEIPTGVAVEPPAPSASPAPSLPTPSALSDAGDIGVSALAALPDASGGGESLQVPRSQAPKPELLTSGLLYAVSGLDAHQAGSYDEAIEFYSLAIEAGDLPDRSLAYVYNNRGASHRSMGRFNRAIEDYDAAIRLNPDYAAAYYNRGIAYDRKGFHSLAIDDYDTAIRLNPDLADAYTQRGVAYARDGRYDIAIENFSQAIRLDPQSDSAYFNRGLAYQSKGEAERAAEDMKKSQALNPGNPEYGEKMRELGIL